MKKIFSLFLLLLIAGTAAAQLQFGVKAGVNITNMSFSRKDVSASNRTGFYVGPTMKYIEGHTGLGFDLSLLYDQRQGEAAWYYGPMQEGYNGKVRQQQITVPINLRWEWDFTEVFGIFVYGGPEYDLNVGKDVDDYYWHWQTSHWSANVGVGIMLMNHLQINANYNFPCGRGGRFHDNPEYRDSKGRFGAWQVGVGLYI